MKRQASYRKFLKQLRKNNHIFAAVLVFASLGLAYQLISRAAAPTISLQPELGTIATGATTIPDTTASDEKVVRFGTTPPTTAAYTVSGNKILNASGQQVILHGVDRPSLEWGCNGNSADGKSSGIPASDFATMRTKWNANAVRIALNQDFWLTGANRYCSGYRATVDAVVQAAKANGLIVILDLHWSDKGNLGNTNPAQQCMADQNSVTFWQQLASVYKNDHKVWFELYNEPQSIPWSVWKNGGAVCGFQAVGMQQLYNTIRGTGATNMVIAGGIVWASHLDGVQLLNGTNIAYAIHPYSNEDNPDAWSTADWDNRFGNLSATVPVIATEFGDSKCGSSYDQAILNYFRAHKVGYTAWAWYVGGCSFPSLVTNNAGDCVNSMGCVIREDMKKYGQ